MQQHFKHNYHNKIYNKQRKKLKNLCEPDTPLPN